MLDPESYTVLSNQEAAGKLIEKLEPCRPDHSLVIFVSGNWYDANKVPEVLTLALLLFRMHWFQSTFQIQIASLSILI